MTFKRNPDPRAGLTLIEVMLAMVIIAIGMTVLVSAASRCLKVIAATDTYQTARELLARVELENPLILEEEIEETTQSGRFTGKFRNYSWRREIILVGEEEDGLYEVRTRIIWSKKGRRPYEEVVTYIYAPPEDEEEI